MDNRTRPPFVKLFNEGKKIAELAKLHGALMAPLKPGSSKSKYWKNKKPGTRPG